jgi:hypothetical protein
MYIKDFRKIVKDNIKKFTTTYGAYPHMLVFSVKDIHSMWYISEFLEKKGAVSFFQKIKNKDFILNISDINCKKTIQINYKKGEVQEI